MTDSADYTPPRVWTWNKGNGGRFANIKHANAAPSASWWRPGTGCWRMAPSQGGNGMLETSVAAVPFADWRLAETVEAARRRRLLEEAPSPERIIADLTDAAFAEARAGALCLHWVHACDEPGFFRLEAAFRVSAELFDWLFNGRTGYRAAYWLSTQHGMLFNAAAVENPAKRA